jgi:hypothetical protein
LLTRLGAILAIFIGIAILVLGIMFIFSASSSEDEIATELQPVKISEVDAKYDTAKAAWLNLRTKEEPGIQAKTAEASASYNYIYVQKTSLSLAKTNIGLVSLVRTMGIIDIILGIGLMLLGLGLLRKAKA